MNWKLDLLSPVSLSAVFILVGAVALVLLIARVFAGPPAEIARRWGLLVIRGIVVLLLLLLLANPVQVRESPGNIERADVFYLMDASESMKMGGDDGTRWDKAIEIIRDADAKTRDKVAADVKLFRFGNRLSSVEERSPESGVRSQEDEKTDVLAAVTPTDTDTRFQMALRQMTSRFGRSPPTSLVVFSDGRARDAEGIEAMARHFADLNVPIHVVPVGDTAKGGDVAIVAAVVPESVRRHSRVEVQVFLRSYGFDDRRVQLHLSAIDDEGNPLRSLTAPQPITLHSGFQSHSLSFRADKDTRRLLIHIPPEADEVSSQNNAIDAETYIDQTKIRVLYVEGTRELPRTIRQGDTNVTRGPYTELQRALTADDDIECVVVSGAYGDLRRMTYNGSFEASRGFPQTSAELSAFDAVILSNVRRDMFTDEQVAWIDRWVSQRGAGLCMVGGPQSFASGGWAGDTIEKMLPVVMNDSQSDWDPGAVVEGKVDMPPTLHPIWHFVSNPNQNRSIVEKFPVFDGINRGLQVKAALSSVLVTVPSGRTAAVQPAVGSGLLAPFLGSQQPAIQTDPGADRSAAGSRLDNASATSAEQPVIAIGRYGKGRSLAMATAITEPWARAFLNEWGEGDSRYYAKFWRNVVYWLTEDSTIGRRRLIATHDKQYYKPGDVVSLRAIAYDEGADETQDYRVVAMIEPKSALLDPDDFYSPVRWPNGIPREEGMEGPLVMWGEEFELPKTSADTAGPLGGNLSGYGIELRLNDVLLSGGANEGLRIELTAMEDQTQVDSTSLEVHILHDPFEHQNPFPDHDLLKEVARVSGGQVLRSSDDLAAMITNVNVKQGPPVVRKSPLWSNWWMWSAIVGLLTVEWLWRRSVGLA